jgi:hypothetical protein
VADESGTVLLDIRIDGSDAATGICYLETLRELHNPIADES